MHPKAFLQLLSGPCHLSQVFAFTLDFNPFLETVLEEPGQKQVQRDLQAIDPL